MAFVLVVLIVSAMETLTHRYKHGDAGVVLSVYERGVDCDLR